MLGRGPLVKTREELTERGREEKWCPKKRKRLETREETKVEERTPGEECKKGSNWLDTEKRQMAGERK